MNNDEYSELTYSKKYYEENKYKICNRTLNIYPFKAMKKIEKAIPQKVKKYLKQYPWDSAMEKYMKNVLFRKNISISNGCYDDCCSAAMVAYMYSIYRCAFMEYDYVESYTKKMINIYIICAINIYNLTNNICKQNNLRRIDVDNEVWNDKI